MTVSKVLESLGIRRPKRPKRALLILAFCALAFGLVLKWLPSLQCRSVMRNVPLGHFFEYRECNERSYPANIVDLILGGNENTNYCALYYHLYHEIDPVTKQLKYPTTEVLSCPGVGLRDITITKAETESDYTYVCWTPFFGTNDPPPKYPVLYDRRYSNHLGLGINVLTVDGYCFWDWRGHWLKAFTREHPEYHLTMPE